MSKTIINSLPKGTILHGKTYDYEILKTLGQGAFGITYLAEVKLRGELGAVNATVYVAIKEFFMHEINGRDNTSVTSGNKEGVYDKYKKKFIGEAKNLSKLKHENIIKVIEAFEENNTIYYSMEYIDGGSLDKLISQKGKLSEEETILYTKQIASALLFMHSKHMLHLDLKPSNIMLQNGSAVLIDFGLSKQFDDDGNPESSTTIGGGTPGYAPLEQVNYQDGHGFPVTMDVYALGATMFKMLTGVRAPEASEILNDGFPYSLINNGKCSQEVKQCVAKAMSPMKKDRFSNIKELLTYLSTKQHEEDTIFEIGDKNSKIRSNSIETIVEELISNKQYREAYSMCLAAVKTNECSDYAMQKIEILVPMLKEQSKKDKFKHWVVAIIITIVGFIITVIASILRY